MDSRHRDLPRKPMFYLWASDILVCPCVHVLHEGIDDAQ